MGRWGCLCVCLINLYKYVWVTLRWTLYVFVFVCFECSCSRCIMFIRFLMVVSRILCEILRTIKQDAAYIFMIVIIIISIKKTVSSYVTGALCCTCFRCTSKRRAIFSACNPHPSLLEWILLPSQWALRNRLSDGNCNRTAWWPSSCASSCDWYSVWWQWKSDRWVCVGGCWLEQASWGCLSVNEAQVIPAFTDTLTESWNDLSLTYSSFQSKYQLFFTG